MSTNVAKSQASVGRPVAMQTVAKPPTLELQLTLNRPDVVSGWQVSAGYAQPATAGGGYVELAGDDVMVAFANDASAREMGLPEFQIIRVPVAVLRALLEQHDNAKPKRLTLTAAERHAAISVALGHYVEAHPGTALSEVTVVELARWHAEKAGAL